MEYVITTNNTNNYGHLKSETIRGLKTWSEVTDFLKNKLSPWTYKVYIYKFSSNNHLLGEKCVTMANLIEIASSSTDKCLI